MQDKRLSVSVLRAEQKAGQHVFFWYCLKTGYLCVFYTHEIVIPPTKKKEEKPQKRKALTGVSQ